ncbi:putative dipeptidyl-peptidase I [Medicago truncatula]|uniref:Putative dipeptidyl-peptidase I n=1 Tax=Medicago truncatula TaxID=3880 RepID=A0A396GRM9_MEDTR|nr:putative dipeptidyl-peptidase I [Medicago truncatula]
MCKMSEGNIHIECIEDVVGGFTCEEVLRTIRDSGIPTEKAFKYTGLPVVSYANEWKTRIIGVYWGPPVPFHLTNHTVLLVGCGVHNKTRYWIVRNTWGTNFGDGGHIKIVRGQNCFGIESEIWVPIIDLDTLCF